MEAPGFYRLIFSASFASALDSCGLDDNASVIAAAPPTPHVGSPRHKPTL